MYSITSTREPSADCFVVRRLTFLFADDSLELLLVVRDAAGGPPPTSCREVLLLVVDEFIDTFEDAAFESLSPDDLDSLLLLVVRLIIVVVVPSAFSIFSTVDPSEAIVVVLRTTFFLGLSLAGIFLIVVRITLVLPLLLDVEATNGSCEADEASILLLELPCISIGVADTAEACPDEAGGAKWCGEALPLGF